MRLIHGDCRDIMSDLINHNHDNGEFLYFQVAATYTKI